MPTNGTPDISTFQGLILALQQYWAAEVASFYSPMTWKWGLEPSTQRLFFEQLVLNAGTRLMCNRQDDRQTEDTATIQIEDNTTTNFKW